MVFDTTFNNISVISWRSVLLVEETRENHRPIASHSQTLSIGFILQDDKEAQSPAELGARRGRDRMIVVFTTTCTISAYHL
jgi:hypothetical protein